MSRREPDEGFSLGDMFVIPVVVVGLIVTSILDRFGLMPHAPPPQPRGTGRDCCRPHACRAPNCRCAPSPASKAKR